jgi:BirA family biotin operon repressor/biotin-[acetyl-CoA-carboxylase] ligase
MNFTILHFDSIDSTNIEALRQARLGADEGMCIVARQQTAGRGRHGRRWVSPKDAGLYLSIILRPKLDAKFLPLITLVSGVAVHDVLTELGLKPDIKWPNDVHVNEKKISGILAETGEGKSGLAVVVGIGLNITSANFPDEIAETATSIETELGRGVTFSELERAVLRFFGYHYDMLCEDDGTATVLTEWQRRSTYFSGKRVRVSLESDSVTGVTDGLEPNGALRIKKEGGDLIIVQAGEVEQLRS